VALAKEDGQCFKYIINYYQAKDFMNRTITSDIFRKQIGQTAVPYLINFLEENYTNSPTRLFSYAQYWIAQDLGELGDKKAIPILINLLDNDVADVRGGAVQALGKLIAVEALPRIEFIAEHDESGYGWFDTMKEIAAEVAEKLRQHQKFD
jgi:HEAT repeat protein